MKILILVMSSLYFMDVGLHAEFYDEFPKETAILQFPDHTESNWKKIKHCVSTKEGIIELIPVNQNIQDCTDLILIQYLNNADLEKYSFSLEQVLKILRNLRISFYPKDTVSWQIIERNKEGIIYEWILHKPYKDDPIQHEVARAFLTSSGLHRIAYTRKGSHIEVDERAKWIKLLRENSSVISFNEGRYIDGLSMFDKLQDSVSLGVDFCDWKIVKQFSLDTGQSLVCYIPPTQPDSCITECLEIMTSPNIKKTSIPDFLEIKKNASKVEQTKNLNSMLLRNLRVKSFFAIVTQKIIFSCML